MLNLIGIFYQRGLVVPQNYIKAFELYDKVAIYNLAESYMYGIGVEKDVRKELGLYVRFDKETFDDISTKIKEIKGKYNLASDNNGKCYYKNLIAQKS